MSWWHPFRFVLCLILFGNVTLLLWLRLRFLLILRHFNKVRHVNIREKWFSKIIHNTSDKVSGLFSSLTFRCVFFKMGKPAPSPKKTKMCDIIYRLRRISAHERLIVAFHVLQVTYQAVLFQCPSLPKAHLQGF